jgi:enoyl-CoA hydratase/carnithine racemase
VVSGGNVLATRDGSIGTITLSVPERRNAISYAMRVELAAMLQELDDDPAIRVVVVTGAGSTFCAGVDLSDGRAPRPSLLGLAMPLVAPFDALSKPLIAAINGPAVGGGFEIALAADIRVAATSAWFALPEVTIGSLPASGGTQRLARALPPAVAAALLYTGDRLSAEDAHRLGLVSALVELGELAQTVQGIAERIAANAPLSLRAVKVALRAAVEQPLAEGRALERALWALLATTEDRAEGRAAFREKRKPNFKGE